MVRVGCIQCFDAVGCAAGRDSDSSNMLDHAAHYKFYVCICMYKGIRPVKKLSGGMLTWLSVRGDVQICIWLSRCHCHSLSLAAVNPDWFYLPGFTSLVPAHPGSPGQSRGP